MKTREFASALATISAELQLPQLDDWLVNRFRQPAHGIDSEIRQSFETLVFSLSNRAAALRTDPVIASVMAKMGLEGILTPNNLAALITLVRTSQDNTTLLHAAGDKRLIWELYFTVRSFLRLEKAVNALLLEDVSGDQNESVVSLILIDHDDRGIPLSHAAAALSRIDKLANALGQLLNVTGDVRIAYADSGSDIGLGVVAEKSVAAVIETLFRDGMRYLRHWSADGFDRKLESLDRGFDFLAKVDERVIAGTLDKGVAARAKREVVKQMSSLMGSGVKLDEDVDWPLEDDRTFLAGGTRQRLLTDGADAKTTTDAADEDAQGD